MNLEALIAMWGQAQGSPGLSGRNHHGQSTTQNFAEFLDAGMTLPGSDSGARAAGERFVTRALDTFAHQMSRAEIGTQPLHELIFPKLTRAFGAKAALDFTGPDSKNSRVDGDPAAFVIVLAKPGGEEVFDEDESRDGRAAITAAFTGRRSNRNAASVSGVPEHQAGGAEQLAELENYAPVIQVDGSSLPDVLDRVFGGAAALTTDRNELPGGAPGAGALGPQGASGLQSTAQMTIEELRQLPAADTSMTSAVELASLVSVPVADIASGLQSSTQVTLEELRHLPVAETGAGSAAEWESLVFVPMTAIASGHLDNRMHSSAAAVYSNGQGETTRLRQSFAAPAPPSAPVVRAASSPRQAVTQGTAVPLPSAPQTPVPHREGGVSAVLRRDFYETLQAVLPPRQNFLLLQLGEEKRLFVRDFYSPADTLRQLGQIAKSSPFDLSDLHVVINGVDHGRLR